ncbi:MAG: hypothetical protein RBR25_07975 [Trichloromonas sp.]|nr:hypothetical protein [Trichloromonas sp.]
MHPLEDDAQVDGDAADDHSRDFAGHDLALVGHLHAEEVVYRVMGNGDRGSDDQARDGAKDGGEGDGGDDCEEAPR